MIFPNEINLSILRKMDVKEKTRKVMKIQTRKVRANMRKKGVNPGDIGRR